MFHNNTTVKRALQQTFSSPLKCSNSSLKPPTTPPPPPANPPNLPNSPQLPNFPQLPNSSNSPNSPKPPQASTTCTHPPCLPQTLNPGCKDSFRVRCAWSSGPTPPRLCSWARHERSEERVVGVGRIVVGIWASVFSWRPERASGSPMDHMFHFSLLGRTWQPGRECMLEIFLNCCCFEWNAGCSIRVCLIFEINASCNRSQLTHQLMEVSRQEATASALF